MMYVVSLLAAASLAFQVPQPQQPVEVADGLVPPPSPRSVAANNPDLTDEMRGDIMMARKMYREAIDFYKPGADKNAVLANKTGIAYHQLGDLGQAKKYYEKAIKLDKTYSEAINNLGTVHYARKSYNNAIKQYQKALRIEPYSASVWTNLGTAFFARKKYDEAFQCYGYALSIDPEVFERRGTNGVLLQERSVEEKARYYFMLSRTYAQAGLVDRALQYMRFSLENGFKDRDRFTKEPEFAALQEMPEFQQILTAEYEVL